MTRTLNRLLVSAALVGAGLVGAAPAGAACAGADASADRLSPPATRAAIRCLTNAARAAHGLPALRPSWRLDRAAQRHTDDMVRAGIFRHLVTSGWSLGERVRSAGYKWRSVAETIAAGYETPRRVVAVWLRSAGHCRAILGPAYSHIGVGFAPTTPFHTAGGTFTQDVALLRGSPPASSDGRPRAGCPHELDTDADGLGDFVPGRFRRLDPCPDVAGQACAGRALVFWVRRTGHRRLRIAGVVVGDRLAPVVGIRVMRRGGQVVGLAPLTATGRFATELRIPAGAGRTRLRVRAYAGSRKLIETFSFR